jgi:hypothetical protein
VKRLRSLKRESKNEIKGKDIVRILIQPTAKGPMIWLAGRVKFGFSILSRSRQSPHESDRSRPGPHHPAVGATSRSVGKQHLKPRNISSELREGN